MSINPTPRVSCTYGAPMGRCGEAPAGPFQGRIRARRIRLDAGGYDSGGAYWGHGQALYYVYSVCEGELCADGFYRASSNAAAIAKAITDHGHDP